jgi:hypothetical protein
VKLQTEHSKSKSAQDNLSVVAVLSERCLDIGVKTREPAPAIASFLHYTCLHIAALRLLFRQLTNRKQFLNIVALRATSCMFNFQHT